MNNSIIYDGNIAYADVIKATGLISKAIENSAEQILGFGVVFHNASKEVKEANRGVLLQRVPEFDIKTEESVVAR